MWFLLALACVLARPPCARAQELNIQRYSTRDGLPATQTLAMLQDRDGYLWFGTTGGLARYDGTEFRTWSRADGLRGNNVTALASTADGRLLIGLREGGVDVLSDAGIAPLAGPGLDDAPIRALVDLGGAEVWMLTDSAVLRLRDGQVQRVAAPASLGLRGPRAVLRDRQGRVWLGADSGLYRLSGATLERVRGVPQGAVRALLEDASGGLWVGTERDILYRQGDRFAPVVPAAGALGPIQSATRAPDGTLWFGAANGAVRIRSGSATQLGIDNGLGEGRVNAVMVDHEGSTWFATDGGVAKLLSSSFATFTRRQGLPGDLVVGLARVDGSLWAATRSGVARYDSDSRFRTVVRADDLGTGFVSSLASGRDGLLIGSAGSVHLWTGKSLRDLGAEIRGTVNALIPGPDGLWIGTDQGLWVERANGNTELEKGFDGIPISDLALSVDGELWVATLGHGLFVRHDRRFTQQLPQEIPADTTIWALFVAADGSVWAASNGAGALRFDSSGSSMVRLTRVGNGLASDFVQQVLPTRRDGVWLYTNRGLDRWDQAVGITHFDLDDGLASMSGTPGAALATGDGDVWFGTPDGLVRFDSTRATSPGVPPVVKIQKMHVDGEPVPPQAALQLAPRPATVSFGFTALTYRNEASTRFQYRLLGSGTEDWSRPDGERTVSFANLPPGEYRLDVQAINDRGLWSTEPASLAFTVRPAVWQIAAVRMGAAITALMLVGTLLWSRFRKVEDERRRLRSMVDKRTRELVEKNTLLERMATTDELTALPNRRFFLESMERELRKMTRLTSEQPLSLLVIDLDRFKSINDRFGHAAGDEVLRQAARRLAQGVRATDLAARYGGEEFAILLPNTNRAGAHFLAEKLRAEIEQAEFRFNGTRIGVTISVGVATVEAPQRYDVAVEEELLRRADEAMYRAKTGGRNRVDVAD